MATNNYFNLFPKNITQEQLLIEDLVIESLKIHGMDIFYMPRSSQDNFDYLYGEDQLKQYTVAYPIEMYLENVTGMSGEGDFMSKFGLEIRDDVNLLVSRRRFLSTVPQIRPNEGDLIYIPLVQNFFEITFVEHENDQAMFYTLGRGRGGNVYVFSLKMKQYVFSNEIIQTGIKEIDEQIRDEYPKVRITLSNVTGKFLVDEVIYQGTSYGARTVDALVHNFTPNTSIDVYRTRGIFQDEYIYGVTSGASANVIIASDTATMNNTFEDIIDNNRIELESDIILDWTEKNPFGES
ncbi:hypothetical protein M0R04_05440 [Candidatus Dojkabacteria bacterium]|jgi:hypothetical protein|nr:hypothetical protein [Candidatus Dojkabacteria bacterium]